MLPHTHNRLATCALKNATMSTFKFLSRHCVCCFNGTQHTQSSRKEKLYTENQIHKDEEKVRRCLEEAGFATLNSASICPRKVRHSQKNCHLLNTILPTFCSSLLVRQKKDVQVFICRSKVLFVCPRLLCPMTGRKTPRHFVTRRHLCDVGPRFFSQVRIDWSLFRDLRGTFFAGFEKRVVNCDFCACRSRQEPAKIRVQNGCAGDSTFWHDFELFQSVPWVWEPEKPSKPRPGVFLAKKSANPLWRFTSNKTPPPKHFARKMTLTFYFIFSSKTPLSHLLTKLKINFHRNRTEDQFHSSRILYRPLLNFNVGRKEIQLFTSTSAHLNQKLLDWPVAFRLQGKQYIRDSKDETHASPFVWC